MRHPFSSAIAAALILAAAASAPRPAAAHGAGDHSHLLADASVVIPTGLPPAPNVPALFAADLELPDTLGVGRIAKDVAEHLPELEALASYLSDRIAALGYARARPVIARDNAEMIDFLTRGIVDVVSETPMSALQFVERGGATIILRERRDNRATYTSIVLIKANSSITTLSDLAGKRLVFEDPGSTTGFAVALAAIRATGLGAVALDNREDAPPADGIGYYFSNSEYPIAAAIARGPADAGALSDQDWRRIEARDRELARELKPLWESVKIPRALVLTGPTVTPQQRDGIRDVLLHAADDGPGRAVLKRYGNVERFDPIDAELERQVEEMRGLYATVRNEVR